MIAREAMNTMEHRDDTSFSFFYQGPANLHWIPAAKVIFLISKNLN